MKPIRLFLIIILFVLTVFWPISTHATIKSFHKGALIIPMDLTYQPSKDGGILEAYGLVFELLQNGISVYWIVDENKTSINAPDITINDNTINPVASYFNHNGASSALGGISNTISYSGAPFVITYSDEVAVINILATTASDWSAVDIHKINVPFTANVVRELTGAPPKIALMNNSESKTGGNASILEAYLRLSGICTNTYDIITPNQIRDGILQQTLIPKGGYDLLWAPHWAGYEKYPTDVEQIVRNVSTFLDSGKSIFAECASIEVFEHSVDGHFLSTNGFGHNGVGKDPFTLNPAGKIIYNNSTSPFAQTGNYSYVPTGGHLHNWRPYQAGDPYSNKLDFPPAAPPNSSYRNTVSRFTLFDIDGNTATSNDQWDYFVGGRKDGDQNKGYVVYLAGHKYAKCTGGAAKNSNPGSHQLSFGFDRKILNEQFEITFKYKTGSTTVNVSKASHNIKTGSPVNVDFTQAEFKDNKIKNVIINNVSSPEVDINIVSINISWINGDNKQKIKKITDETADIVIWNNKVSSPAKLNTSDMLIEKPTTTSSVTSCTNNSDCTVSNIAAVRYVLNTLFNLQFTVVKAKEYVRSTPVVSENILYQGTFEYPSYEGHFKAYDIKLETEKWDAADSIPADSNNMGSVRKVFTYIGGAKEPFTIGNIANLKNSLDLTPNNGDDSDELDLIKRVRGLVKTGKTWSDTSINKLGGIEHSAAAIVTPNKKVNPSRKTVAYVGGLDGMLHAFDVNRNGAELWAFIPGNVLGKLKNDRTDPNSINDYAAVDASPTVRDVYLNGQWKTVLTCVEGDGGNSIFAIDITDPDNPAVMWEKTEAGSGEGYSSGMGHALRTTISKVKASGGIKYSIITASNYADKGAGNGGLQLFSYDLGTGNKNWQFSADYTSAINDIPGAIASYDIDGDSFADRLVAGDMEGRLWELDIIDGTNPNGADTTQITHGVYLNQTDKTKDFNMPLFNAGIGKPIAASPSIVKINNHIVVIFGTGGTDWADNNGSYAIIAVDATDAYKIKTPTYSSGVGPEQFSIHLAKGEKVWSAPTIAAGQIYFASAFGILEGANPADNLLDTTSTSNTGNIYAFDIALDSAKSAWKESNVGQVRSSVYISDEHLYTSTLGGNTLGVGSGKYNNPLVGGQLRAISWQDKAIVK